MESVIFPEDGILVWNCEQILYFAEFIVRVSSLSYNMNQVYFK